MSIIKCQGCGNTVSDQARFCPHCGSPLKSADPVRNNTQQPQQPETGRQPLQFNWQPQQPQPQQPQAQPYQQQYHQPQQPQYQQQPYQQPQQQYRPQGQCQQPYQQTHPTEVIPLKKKQSAVPYIIGGAVLLVLVIVAAAYMLFFRTGAPFAFGDKGDDEVAEEAVYASNPDDYSAPVAAESTAATVDSPRMQSLERAFDNLFLASTARYFLYDFDNDGTKEIVVDCKGEGYSSQLKVLAFSGNDVVRFGTVENPDCLYRISGGKLYRLEPFGEGYAADRIYWNGNFIAKQRVYTPVDEFTSAYACPYYEETPVTWYSASNLAPAVQ